MHRARVRQAPSGAALLGVLLGIAAAAAAGPVAEPTATISIADLAWIAGSWETESGAKRFEEHWTRPASNALLGMSRTLSGDRMVFFEFLRIEARDDGLYYVAQPKGRPPTDFKLTRYDGREAVFENPEHDFPKRIRYQRNPDGSMTARTDGGEGVEKGALTFPYRRMSPTR